MNLCDFHDATDDELQPDGPACGEPATHMIRWTESRRDGVVQFSFACTPHADPDVLVGCPAYTISPLIREESP